jgi:hypothetical protein
VWLFSCERLLLGLPGARSALPAATSVRVDALILRKSARTYGSCNHNTHVKLMKDEVPSVLAPLTSCQEADNDPGSSSSMTMNILSVHVQCQVGCREVVAGGALSRQGRTKRGNTNDFENSEPRGRHCIQSSVMRGPRGCSSDVAGLFWIAGRARSL